MTKPAMNPIRLLVCLASLCAMQNPAEASPTETLRISQAIGALPAITVYLDARSTDGTSSPALDPAQLLANLGENAAEVAGLQTFDQTHEGVAYLMLVDASKSLTPERFGQMRSALQNWRESLQNKDRMAIMSFGDSVRMLAPFTADQAALKQVIDGLKAVDKTTALHQALTQSMDFLHNAGLDLPTRRVIVILSDGINDAAGGVTREEVLERMKVDRIPVYAIGFSSPPLTATKQAGLTELGVFARSSGGEYLPADNRSLNSVYAELRRHIRAVWRLQLSCMACKGDGRVYRLQVNYQSGNQTLTDGLDLRLIPKGTAPAVSKVTETASGQQQDSSSVPIAIAAALASTFGIAFYLYLRLTKKPTIPSGSAAAQDVKPSGLSPKPTPGKPLGWKIALTEVSGHSPGTTHQAYLEKELSIGRSLLCAVAIDHDSEISAWHCQLQRQAQGLFITDANSTNGTLVNGVPITRAYRLQQGDLILLGRTELRIAWDES